MRRSRLIVLPATLILSFACGGGSKNPAAPPNNPNAVGSMSASIDGTNWSAIAVTARKSNGIVIASGSDAVRTVTISFLPNGTGNQQIAANSVALAILLIGGQSWSANAVGQGGGTVNLTTLTATRAVGTFTFTAVASQGTTPATRQVTNGKFDVRF